MTISQIGMVVESSVGNWQRSKFEYSVTSPQANQAWFFPEIGNKKLRKISANIHSMNWLMLYNFVVGSVIL